jgi:hypothetical protein
MIESANSSPRGTIRSLPTSSIQRGGQTQHRLKIDVGIVAAYAALMHEGVEFPAVRVWWDGEKYWMSDGFQRLAAAESVGITEIRAEITCGTLADARWDSYAANALHGARRSREETHLIVQRALQHPNAASSSNMQIAKHLCVSEATVRRLRQRPS